MQLTINRRISGDCLLGAFQRVSLAALLLGLLLTACEGAAPDATGHPRPTPTATRVVPPTPTPFPYGTIKVDDPTQWTDHRVHVTIICDPQHITVTQNPPNVAPHIKVECD